MKYLLFDTETTGLTIAHAAALDNQPHVIEFFGALLTFDPDANAWEDGPEVEILVKPPVPISEEITRITGITPELVADCSLISAAFPTIRHAIETADAVVAHNLSFDRAIIDNEATRLGVTLKWPLQYNCICTVERTEWLHQRRLSLTDLHKELFGEGFASAHRARHDVMALIRCFKELVAREFI